MSEYPDALLAREAAPPFEGEGPFALWHFSEDPSLERFSPRARASNPREPALVWAADTRHAPMFWFPRDCPRGCVWPVTTTTAEDVERFFGQTSATRIHVIEADWLERMRACHLYAYRLPTAAFRPHVTVGGYWVADGQVDALDRVDLGDLLARHAAARIELRITPSIWPFWRRVTASTLEFSGSRLRNAAPDLYELKRLQTAVYAPGLPAKSPSRSPSTSEAYYHGSRQRPTTICWRPGQTRA